LQRKSHWAASQRTSLMHAPGAMQRTSHELPPQLMLPEQLLGPEHSTVQLSASRHSTPLEQEPMPVHATEQGTPTGHFTPSGQGWSSSQVMTQTALSHTPLVQAFWQSASVASGLGAAGMPPLAVPAAVSPPLALLPPLSLPASVDGAPPLPTLPPAELVPALGAPPETLSNKAFSAGPPQATNQLKTKPAPPARAPRRTPAYIAAESNIEKALCW
jgi:hypothetical protein